MAEFNWLLVIVTVVVALLSVGVSLYLIIIYQHPQDKNQAWFPKFVVLCGFSLAFMTVLLFPLDVANTASCELDLPLSSCTYTFPMDLLWQIAYIANVVIVFLLVPFTIFFYEADSDL
jgi:LMBR1 domain-containing protein 1